MIAETNMDTIIAHERLVTHDTNSLAARCQHVSVFQLRSASWLCMLEVKCARYGWDCVVQDWMENERPLIWGATTSEACHENGPALV